MTGVLCGGAVRPGEGSDRSRRTNSTDWGPACGGRRARPGRRGGEGHTRPAVSRQPVTRPPIPRVFQPVLRGQGPGQSRGQGQSRLAAVNTSVTGHPAPSSTHDYLGTGRH